LFFMHMLQFAALIDTLWGCRHLRRKVPYGFAVRQFVVPASHPILLEMVSLRRKVPHGFAVRQFVVPASHPILLGMMSLRRKVPHGFAVRQFVTSRRWVAPITMTA